MYRIRLASGEEAVYRTVQELAQAVASGMVSPTAEVYHKAANRWLPINTHPDYRAAIITGKQTAINPKIVIPNTPARGSEAIPVLPPPGPTPRTSVSPAVNPGTPAAPAPAPQETVKNPGIHLTPPARQPAGETERNPAIQAGPSGSRGSSDTIKQAALPEIELDLLPAEAELIALDQPTAAVVPIIMEPARPPRSTGSRRTQILIGAAAGVVVLGVIGTAFALRRAARKPEIVVDSVALAAGLRTDSLRDSTIAAAAPAAAAAVPLQVPRTTPPVQSYPAPSEPLPAPKPVAIKRDSAPKPLPPVVSRMKGTVSRTPSYYQAYADARSEMDESLNYVDFRRVFQTSRLASADSLRAAKRMVVAAGNIMRVYRGREVMLEQTYRADDPDGRSSLREPFETSQAARALLSSVDSLFSILVSQEGEMTVGEHEIRFRNTRIARSYNQVRQEIVGTISAWRDSAEASNRVTMPRLVQAIGPVLPPPGR